MEDHSGLVDNFRDFKSNPEPIRNALLPVRPVAKQKALVAALGETVKFDLYLLNDSDRPASGKLDFAITDPKNATKAIGSYDAPAFVRDQLSYLIKEDVSSPALDEEGVWTTHFALGSDSESAHSQEIWVVNPTPHQFNNLHVAMLGLSDEMSAQLAPIPGLVLAPFTAGQHYDLIIASPATEKPTDTVSTDDVGADRRSRSIPPTQLPQPIVDAFNGGTPLFVLCTNDGQATGAGAQMAAAAGFRFDGMVGSSRASWMGTWFFVRRHPVYEGLPVDRAMSIEYQVKGSDSNGLMIDGDGLEIIAAYSRDHDRNIGAGTFTYAGRGRKLLFHRITEMHRVFHRRLLANGIQFLTQNA
jgi:beta-galactosidase